MRRNITSHCYLTSKIGFPLAALDNLFRAKSAKGLRKAARNAFQSPAFNFARSFE